MRVVVLGGGSAGWIAAATLQARLNGAGPGPVSLTVVESPDTPRIGVGEATIPTFRNVLQRAGLDEAAAMAACQATFKHAIRFDDWTGPGTSYCHPFHRWNGPGGQALAAAWLASDGRTPFAETVSAQPALMRAERAPKPPGTPGYEGPLPYAYHLDADLLADLFRDTLSAQGVAHVAAHVAEVARDAAGRVAALVTTDGRRITADLYVDATGFRALLSPSAHDAGGWISYADRLLCDRAVTLRVPRGDRPPLPHTRARALSAGWCWDIGLRHRRGRGYVYCSRFLSDAAAEAELRAEEGPAAEGIPARVIPFRTGRMAAPWQGNVVALGLTAGFLEPLESTGLYLADYAARALCEMFPPAPGLDPAPLAKRYNALMAEMHDSLAEFLALHYAVADRPEPFWQAARTAGRTAVADYLALWELRPPSFADFSLRYPPFSHQAWEFILLGSGWRPAMAPPGPGPAQVPGDLARMTAALLRDLPAHADALPPLTAGAGAPS